MKAKTKTNPQTAPETANETENTRPALGDLLFFTSRLPETARLSPENAKRLHDMAAAEAAAVTLVLQILVEEVLDGEPFEWSISRLIGERESIHCDLQAAASAIVGSGTGGTDGRETPQTLSALPYCRLLPEAAKLPESVLDCIGAELDAVRLVSELGENAQRHGADLGNFLNDLSRGLPPLQRMYEDARAISEQQE